MTQLASEFTCQILSSELAMTSKHRNRNLVKTFLDHSAFQRINENYIFSQKHILSTLFSVIGLTLV